MRLAFRDCKRISGDVIPYQNHSPRAPALFPRSACTEQRFPFSYIALATSAHSAPCAAQTMPRPVCTPPVPWPHRPHGPLRASEQARGALFRQPAVHPPLRFPASSQQKSPARLTRTNGHTRRACIAMRGIAMRGIAMRGIAMRCIAMRCIAMRCIANQLAFPSKAFRQKQIPP